MSFYELFIYNKNLQHLQKYICNSEYIRAILHSGSIHLGNPGPPVALQTVAQTEIHEEISYTVYCIIISTILCQNLLSVFI